MSIQPRKKQVAPSVKVPIGILAYFGDEITKQKATTSRRIVTKPLSEQVEMLYTQNRITTVVKKAKKRTIADILA